MRNHLDFIAILFLAAVYVLPGTPRHFNTEHFEHKLDQAEKRLDFKVRQIEGKHDRIHRSIQHKLQNLI